MPTSEWRSDPWLGLALYWQPIDTFGWDVLKAVYAEYENDKDLQHGASDIDEMDQFMVIWSQKAGVNMAGYFASWGFDLPSKDSSLITSLPMWDETPHTTQPPTATV
jgi:hypothetical protein